jgi:hypothetical protein
MKSIYSLTLLALLALTVPAQAQYDPSYIVNNINIASGSSSNVAAVFGCTRYENIGVQVDFNLTGAGTDPVVVTWCTSQDGTNYCTATGSYKGNFSIAANGTTHVTLVTNLAVNAVGYFQVSSIAGSTNAATTNVYVSVWTKNRAHGP